MADHFFENLCGATKQRELLLHGRKDLIGGRADRHPFRNLLHRLGYLVESIGERLDIFPLQRSVELAAERFRNLVANLFVRNSLATQLHQLGVNGTLTEMLHQADQAARSCLCLSRTGCEQLEESTITAKNALNQGH